MVSFKLHGQPDQVGHRRIWSRLEARWEAQKRRAFATNKKWPDVSIGTLNPIVFVVVVTIVLAVVVVLVLVLLVVVVVFVVVVVVVVVFLPKHFPKMPPFWEETWPFQGSFEHGRCGFWSHRCEWRWAGVVVGWDITRTYSDTAWVKLYVYDMFCLRSHKVVTYVATSWVKLSN